MLEKGTVAVTEEDARFWRALYDEKIEDACSLGFALEGEFNPDMLAGIESKWDVWEWQAARTPNGYALDKTHIYSRQRPEGVKSKRFQDRREKPIFLARPDDAGTPAWKRLEPPTEKKGPKLPQFEPQTPSGSAADVQARGVWADGKWTARWTWRRCRFMCGRERSCLSAR